MAITEQEFAAAETRMQDARRRGTAVRAVYDANSNRVCVYLHTGMELMFSPDLVAELGGASAVALADIQISPSGLGLYWPQLDIDLYIPSLLEGQFTSRKLAAREMGALGGRSRSPAKRAAARVNGAKGGRPRKLQA